MSVFNQSIISWLGQATVQASVLIMVFLLVKRLAQSRLSVRWHHALWIVLLLRMSFPWNIGGYLDWATWLPSDTQQGINNWATMEFTIFRNSSASFLHSFTVLDLFIIIWFLVACILAAIVLFENLKLWRAVRTEPALLDIDVLKRLESCKKQLGIHTPLSLVLTQQINTPALFGFIRPRLLLPKKLFETLSIEELSHIFLHELAHLKRHDIFVGWLMAVLQIAHWYNPLVWIAFRQLRQDRELAADALALSKLDNQDVNSYGQTILHLLNHISGANRLPSLAGVLEQKSNTKRRIQMVLNYKQKSYRWSPASILVLIALVGISFGSSAVQDNYAEGKSANIEPAAVGKDLVSKSEGKGKRPVPIKRVDPIYPEEAAKNNIQGRVIMEFSISKTGKVKNAKVISAAPKGVFDQAALEALRQWEYAPRIKNGKAVEVTGVVISLNFQL